MSEATSQIEGDEYIPAQDSENMKLWRLVEKTPTSQVKAAKIGQMNIKSIKPHYQRQQATEQWGPFGNKWGVRGENFRSVEIGGTHLLKYSAVLYYPAAENEEGSFPINATTKEAYVTKSGKGYLLIDDNADKKVATDALTKGLSFLGFGADVFHGLYDDIGYVAMLQAEEGAASQIDAIDDKQKLKSEYAHTLTSIAMADDINELERLFFPALTKFSVNSKWVNEINEVKTKRMKKLLGDN